MKVVIHHIAQEDWFPVLAGEFPDMNWAISTSLESFRREIPDADILLLTNRSCTRALGEVLREQASALKWIHFLTAGMDNAITMGLPRNVPISNASGVKANMVAEHALTLLLALTRRAPDIFREQRAHRWMREDISRAMGTLEGATVCIVGLGHVGRDIARKLRAFDARAIAVSREGEDGGDIDAVFRREEMGHAFGQSDAIVIATSADASTRHLIGPDAFADMKRGTVLVNVSRGSIVDEAALIDALRSGHLAGAGLDVQELEPLPAESPLWDLPNVIVSPHSAGAGSSGYFQHRALFGRNLERFLAGRELLNPVRL